MKCYVQMVLLAVIGLAALPASAVEPGTCDPSVDEYGCECDPELEMDGYCNEISASNLVGPDDPEALRQAVGVTTTWNSDDEVYVVEMDVSDFNGGAILPLNSNRGEWSSPDALTEYLSELTNVPIQSNGELAPYRFKQIGRTYRWNQFEGRWAHQSSGNLLVDSVTDETGRMNFEKPVGRIEGGFDQQRDEECKDDKEGKLYHHQCSATYKRRIYAYDEFGNQLVDKGFNRRAYTKIDEICWDGNCGSILKVESVSPPRFRIEEVTSESVYIANAYFNDSSSGPQTIISYSEVDVSAFISGCGFAVRGSIPGYICPSTFAGVCGHGQASQYNPDTGSDDNTIVDSTRAGAYNSSWHSSQQSWPDCRD